MFYIRIPWNLTVPTELGSTIKSLLYMAVFSAKYCDKQFGYGSAGPDSLLGTTYEEVFVHWFTTLFILYLYVNSKEYIDISMVMVLCIFHDISMVMVLCIFHGLRWHVGCLVRDGDRDTRTMVWKSRWINFGLADEKCLSIKMQELLAILFVPDAARPKQRIYANRRH